MKTHQEKNPIHVYFLIQIHFLIDSCIACFSQYYSSVIHLQDYSNVVHLKFDIKVVPFITTEEPQDF